MLGWVRGAWAGERRDGGWHLLVLLHLLHLLHLLATVPARVPAGVPCGVPRGVATGARVAAFGAWWVHPEGERNSVLTLQK